VQRNEGIDAVIVDSVLRVRKGLQGPSQNASTNGVDGATLVVPSSSASVPTINEAAEGLQGLDLNGHAPKLVGQAQKA
jgi:glycerophosphodiester phosphodiesterase